MQTPTASLSSQDGVTHIVHHCFSIHEFFKHIVQLRISDHYWRGVSQSAFPLVPSALRLGRARFARPFEPIDERGEEVIRDDFRRKSIREEFGTARSFYLSAHDRGLQLPHIPHALHNALMTDEPFDIDLDSVWPPIELLPILGLAQHYGLETRLLDWSSDPYSAAYFSCREILPSDGSKASREDDQLALWAVSKHWLSSANKFTRMPRADPRISDGIPNRHGSWCRAVFVQNTGNPNLTAQQGLFLLRLDNVREQEILPEVPLDVAHYVLAMRELGRPLGEFNHSVTPIFRKLTLPWSRAPELLIALRERGYHAGKLFPGLDGCASFVKEQRQLPR